MLGIDKKIRPVSWISKKTWDSLKKKERAYLVYKYGKRKYTKAQYMDLLYFDDNSSYWYFLKRLNNKLSGDIEKINKTK